MASNVSRCRPGFRRHLDRSGGVQSDHVFDLFGHPVTIGSGQVDLVEDRHDLMVGVHRVVHVGQRLRLHPLGASTTSKEPSTARMERDTS